MGLMCNGPPSGGRKAAIFKGAAGMWERRQAHRFRLHNFAGTCEALCTPRRYVAWHRLFNTRRKWLFALAYISRRLLKAGARSQAR